MMNLPLLAWLLILGAASYLLVSCVLSVLAAQVRDDLGRHDLIRRTMQRRADYIHGLAQRAQRVPNKPR
ncbi:MAG TPA: hypothetical protein VF184_00560 [Phycisphaeraceae bacterium]